MTQEVITLIHDLLLGMSQNCHSRYYRADIQATEMEACAKDEEALEDIAKNMRLQAEEIRKQCCIADQALEEFNDFRTKSEYVKPDLSVLRGEINQLRAELLQERHKRARLQAAYKDVLTSYLDHMQKCQGTDKGGSEKTRVVSELVAEKLADFWP